MAADFITITRDQSAATEAGELLQWLRDLRSVYERGTRIRAKMRHTFDSAPADKDKDWTALQTKWGIPSNSTNVGTAANGKAIFTYLDGAVGSMEGAFQTNAVQEVTERVG